MEEKRASNDVLVHLCLMYIILLVNIQIKNCYAHKSHILSNLLSDDFGKNVLKYSMNIWGRTALFVIIGRGENYDTNSACLRVCKDYFPLNAFH